MGNFSKKFGGVSFLLQGVRVIGSSYDVDSVRNQLPFLSFPLRRNQCAAHDHRRSS